MPYIVFEYSLDFFILYVVLNFIVSGEFIYFGYLFFFVSKKHEIPRLKILSFGFIILGVALLLKTFGNIYFATYGTAETPVSIAGITIHFLPVCVGLSIFATFLWYTSLYAYARLQRSDRIGGLDYPIIAIGVIGACISLLPQNMWMRTDIPRFQEPTPWNPNPPIYIESVIRLTTGLLLILCSFLTVLAYYLLYRLKLRMQPRDIVVLKRHEYMLVGILLMVFAVVPITIRDVAVLRGEEIISPTLMSLILSTFFQIFSALALYIGILAPEWMVKRWSEK